MNQRPTDTRRLQDKGRVRGGKRSQGSGVERTSERPKEIFLAYEKKKKKTFEAGGKKKRPQGFLRGNQL